MLTTLNQWLRENLDIIVFAAIVFAVEISRERAVLARRVDQTNQRLDKLTDKFKEIDDLCVEMGQLRHDLSALWCLVASHVTMFLNASPTDTERMRFQMICEEADARCADEETRTALRRIVQWEGDNAGWVVPRGP